MTAPPAARAVIVAALHDWLATDEPTLRGAADRVLAALDLTGWDITPRTTAPPADPTHTEETR